MHQLLLTILIVVLIIVFLFVFKPIRAKSNVLKDILTMKIHTVNMLNKVLKIDTTKMVNDTIPDTHCDGIISSILSPDELVKLSHQNTTLYNKLVACGYTRTVGLLHGFALWSSTSKTKDLKSLKYFIDCVNHIQWKDPSLFVNFHSTTSKIGKCII